MAEKQPEGFSWKAPSLQYLDIWNKREYEQWAYLMYSPTPVTRCTRCGRYVKDPFREPLDWSLDLMPGQRELLEEQQRHLLCAVCVSEDRNRELERDVLELLESKLGLAERHRDALRSFIETIFTDLQKILQVRDLDNRVRHLERQNGIMWTVISGTIIALLALVVTLIVTAL